MLSASVGTLNTCVQNRHLRGANDGLLIANSEQMRDVKEALHVSTLPVGIVCRQDVHKKVLEFCKSYVEKERSGSLYVCGCPGTGKTMVMEKVKHSLTGWSKQADLQEPDVLSINCTSLTNISEVFVKILQKF